MLDIIRNTYKRWVDESALRAEEVRNMLDSAKVFHSTIEEASGMVTERSGGQGWDQTGASKYSHTPSDRQSMIRQCRNMARFDPNAKAALLNVVYYIVGEGVKVNPCSKDERIHKLWREFWEAPRNRMALRFPEFVLRTLRDGEVFLQYFSKDDTGAPSWKTTVRFRDPELLTQAPLEYAGAQVDTTEGIQVDPDDPERALRYFIKKSESSGLVDVVDAKDIQHAKILADSEQKRGESHLQAILKLVASYDDWLRYRIILNKVRTAIVLVRKIEGGTSDDVKKIAAGISQSSTAKDGSVAKRMPNPGTMLTASAGVDYRFESANINAADAADDGRNMKLGMAAGTNNPEYVFGDASNANYASTMIAESPFVKGIRHWQTIFEWHLKEMFRRVVQAAVDAGKLTAPAEDDIFAEPGEQLAEAGDPKAAKEQPETGEAPTGKESSQGQQGTSPTPGSLISDAEAFFKCDVQWPEIIHRDIKQLTDSVVAQRNAKLVSEPTAAQMLGHDYEEEVRRQAVIEETSAENPFKQQADPFEDPGMSAEIDAAMQSLSPDEAQSILKSGDMGGIMKTIQTKRKAGMMGKKQPFAKKKGAQGE